MDEKKAAKLCSSPHSTSSLNFLSYPWKGDPPGCPSMQPKGKSETNKDPRPWELLKSKFQGSHQQYADERNAMWKKDLIKIEAVVNKEKFEHRDDR